MNVWLTSKLHAMMASFVVVLSLVMLTGSVATAASNPTCQFSQTAGNPFACACGSNVSATSGAAACKTDGSDPVTGNSGILSKVRIIIAVIAGVAAIIIIVFNGFRLIVSGGDAQKVANARNAIIYTLVGIVIIVIAGVLISFVIKGVK